MGEIILKKIAIAVLLTFLVAGSSYTVYKYNNSAANKINTDAAKQTESVETSSKGSPEQNKNTESPFKDEVLVNADKTKTKAIDFKLKDLNGKEVSLSDFKGKKVFLNFWATWCPPCKAEMPEMEKLYQETKDSDLVILAVNLAEDRNTVQNFISKNNYNFSVLLDSENAAAVQYKIVSIPTSYFIDEEGNIVATHVGSMTIEDMKGYIDKIK